MPDTSIIYVQYAIMLQGICQIESPFSLYDGNNLHNAKYITHQLLTISKSFTIGAIQLPCGRSLGEGRMGRPKYGLVSCRVTGGHLGKFPIWSYLKVKDSTKSLVTFLVLVRGNFYLYHLKEYLYSFILSRGFKFLGAPFMA